MGEVHVTKASSLKPSGGQTEGMIRMNAITDLSDQLCASLMIAKPHTTSDVHHHGSEDTVIYAVSGHGVVVSNEGKTRQHLAPGDWALIPAYTEHQEANESDEDVTWVIARGGRSPIVENLEHWGASKSGS